MKYHSCPFWLPLACHTNACVSVCVRVLLLSTGNCTISGAIKCESRTKLICSFFQARGEIIYVNNLPHPPSSACPKMIADPFPKNLLILSTKKECVFHTLRGASWMEMKACAPLCRLGHRAAAERGVKEQRAGVTRWISACLCCYSSIAGRVCIAKIPIQHFSLSRTEMSVVPQKEHKPE